MWRYTPKWGLLCASCKIILPSRSSRWSTATCWKGSVMSLAVFKCISHPQENVKRKQGKEKPSSDRKWQAGIYALWELSGCWMILRTILLFSLENTLLWGLSTRKTGLRSRGPVSLLFQTVGLSMTDQKGARRVLDVGQRVYWNMWGTRGQEKHL